MFLLSRLFSVFLFFLSVIEVYMLLEKIFFQIFRKRPICYQTVDFIEPGYFCYAVSINFAGIH